MIGAFPCSRHPNNGTMNYSFITSLLDAHDPGLVGLKAFNLHLLYRESFCIPPACCVTTKAYEDFIDENCLRREIRETIHADSMSHIHKSKKLTALILSGKVPKGLREELTENDLLNQVNTKWAVRSSSNLEDLPSTSFSGLYDSFLNVQGLDSILTSIKKCWASLWSERAIAYRERNNLDHLRVSMAVIIQSMVTPQYSGVCFTEKPGLEKTDDMYVEYCEGLGDRLVSGMVIPYSCEINKTCRVILHRKAPEGREFGDDSIYKLLELALRVENYFGLPQDFEWAMADNRFYLLQSRPISRTRSSLPLSEVWTRANIGEVLPGIVTPLTWDVFRTTLDSTSSSMTPQNDVSDKGEGLRRIHGRAYVRLDNFLNSFCYLPTVTPEVMTRALGIALPSPMGKYSRPSGILVRFAQGSFGMDVLGFLPRIRRMVKRLSPLPAADWERIGEIMDWTTRCFGLHIKCTAYAIGTFGLLTYALKRWIPSKSNEVLSEILIGQENLQTAVQGISLLQLVEHIRKNSTLRGIFQDNVDWGVIEERLRSAESGTEFLAMFKVFLDVNGARAAGEFELAVPRWREDPTFLCSMLRKFLNSESDEPLNKLAARRRRQREVAGQVKMSLPKVRRWVFSRLLSSYSEYITFRENMKYRLIEGYALLRELFVNIGRNMVSKGMLDEIGDIFFLTVSEVVELEGGHSSIEQTAKLIRSRKRQYVLWQSEIVSDVVVGEHHETPPCPFNELLGIGCSPGVSEGYARVLSDTSDAESFKPGEILIAPHTDPGWTPLFLSCKALVTEIGGFLSHGANVAREYGIPAVVSVKNATTRIRTGDFVKVDGTNGRISICNRLKRETTEDLEISKQL